MLLKLLLTYMAVSFAAGIALMLTDALVGLQGRWVVPTVSALYIPPLAIVGAGVLVAALIRIWN